MSLLKLFDAGVAALCLTVAMVQAVVCVLYGFTLDVAPRLSAELPTLVASTAIFLAVGLVFLAGFLGLLRGRPWRWPVQLLGLLLLAPAGLALYRLMS